MFFKNTRDESSLFHRDLYSIFFKVDELNSEGIENFLENTSNRAVDIVKSVYNNVETILMGLGLFTLGRELYDVEVLMRQFSESVDDILVKEIQRITDFLGNENQNYLDLLSVFPEFCLE